jgi:lipopolysaccharide transport system ATP-binding protein
MSNVAIRVENLTKAYRIGLNEQRHETLAGSIMSFVKSPLSNFRELRKLTSFDGPEEADVFWALRGLTFDVERGEVVGIVGRNGAGKSTLLKILSRITEPTGGRAHVNGRVGSLLEVGTGFHPDLTGRENVYLNGTILGMKRREIDRKFDEIVEFADITKFIDTPVKRYSSGMRVRLAFAVAAHLEPEILIVDEVLAVGDVQFQKKCLGKMQDVAGQGRTILFVSHNMAAVEGLCTRAVWLHQGTVQAIGDVDAIVAHYLQTSVRECMEQSWPDPRQAPGNDDVRLRGVRIRPMDASVQLNLRLSTPFKIEFDYWNMKPDHRLNLSVSLINQEGTLVFTTTTIGDPNWHGRPFPVGLFRSTGIIPGHLLNSGTYRVNLLVVQDSARVVHRQEDCIVFEVHDEPNPNSAYFGKWAGVVRPELQWRTELMEQGPEAVVAPAA